MHTSRHHLLSVLVVPVLALLAFSCGSSDDTTAQTTTSTTSTSGAAASSTTNASGGTVNFDCASADTDAVKAVLGTAPAAQELSEKGISACVWYAGAESVAAVNVGTVGMFSRDFDAAKATGTPVAGLGDEAFVAPGTIEGGSFLASGRTLWVKTGTTVYAISVDSTTTPEPTEAQLKAIAEPFVS